MIQLIRYSQLDQLKHPQLVDVRTKEERAHFHIGGIHLPTLEDLSVLDPLLPIVVYCRSGKRSLIAAYEIEKRLNVKEIYSLEEGIVHLED